MTGKIYHTRESILSRLDQGPAQFAEWAFSRKSGHGSRVQARKIVDELVSEGLIRRAHIGKYPYYMRNTQEALRQAAMMQIEECSKESPCGCVLWTGIVNPNIGPIVRLVGADAQKSVRRVMWRMHKGPLGPNDLVKMSCSDEACICLSHMVKKKRNTHHIGRPKTILARTRMAEVARSRGKLTIEDARHIRTSPENNKTLAERYGVSSSNISSIRRGITMRDMTPSPFAGLMG